MSKYLDLQGKEIYSTSKKQIGFIENAIINYKQRKVVSYIVSTESIFPKKYILPINNLTYKNYDLFTSEPLERIKRKVCSKYKGFMAMDLIGRQVFDNHEALIGEIEDLVFDSHSGKIKAIVCKRGFFDDLIKGKKILLINNNVVFNEEKIVFPQSSIEIISEIAFKSEFEEVNL